jgi:hypothetical protein
MNENKTNNQILSIIENFKYRLPMFLITVHCTVLQSVFSEVNKPDRALYIVEWFESYYLLITLLCLIWSAWHAIRSTLTVRSSCNIKLGFIVCETFTSVILFIDISNFLSFNIPFNMLLNLDQYTSMFVYGITIPLIYIMNSIEVYYCNDLLSIYKDIEEKDDIKDRNIPAYATDYGTIN